MSGSGVLIPTTVPTLSAPDVNRTRIALRQQIADRLGDWETGYCTNTVASYTTISDYRRTEGDSAYWENADIVLTYSDGARDTRRVKSYTPSVAGVDGGVILVNATLSQLPDDDTTYDLHRTWRVESYNRAINAAIRLLGDEGAEVIHTSQALTATDGTSCYVVPTASGIDRILDLYTLDDQNYNVPTKWSKQTWRPFRESGVLKIWTDNATRLTAGDVVYVEGAGAPLTLDTDAAVLEHEVPAEAIVAQACMELSLRNWSTTDPAASANKVAFYAQEANARRKSGLPTVRKGRLVSRSW